MKPRMTDLTAEFVYTINCPVDAFFDIYDSVNQEIDDCIAQEWVSLAINETCVEIYNHIEPTLPVDWAKIIISNADGQALMDYLEIFEEHLADWYDVNQKKTNPERASDSR
jgi:hypothetical protein